MHFKITHYLLLSSFVSCIMAKAVYPGGCYECEEEVWEEIPCDEIPSNSTTVAPPCYYTTTPSTPITTIDPITTTMPTTTTPTTTVPTTTIPITTMPILTTTTPSPIEITTPKDPYKKCYCECKVGCKEFCRKVIVNPDPKVHVVQVSKITAPKAQGPIEYTHYHQRELLHKPHHHDKHYQSYSDIDQQRSKEITDYNNYSNKHYTSTQAPPAHSCKGTIVKEPEIYVTAYKKQSYKPYSPKPKIPYYTKPQTTPVPSYPVYETSYARAEAGCNHPYSPETKAQPPTKYYGEAAAYEFPVPLEKIYTKVSKTIHGSPDNEGLTYTDLTPPHSNTKTQSLGYAQTASLKDSQLDTDAYIRNTLQYDDSFNTLINEYLENNPSNPAPYEAYSSPFYSVSYIRS